MKGIEINFVLKDSLEALKLYEQLFDIKVIEKSELPRGQNEAVFTLYDMRFHMLDENKEFNLHAPVKGGSTSLWFNVLVEDLEEIYHRALDLGCTSLQEITHFEVFGVSNASVLDPFGYVWLLQQVHQELSHEERIRLWQERMAENDAGE